MTKLRIAVNGFKVGEMLFLDVSAWGKTGGHANTYLHKGSRVLVSDNLSVRNYGGGALAACRAY